MTSPVDLRLPPHAIESEQSVLGGLLLSNQAWGQIDGVLSDTDFYRDEHRRIFRQIRSLLEMGKPADVVTVAEALDASGEGQHTGGLAYLGELAANTPSAANIRRYAEIVRDRRLRRDLMDVGQQIADMAAASTTDSVVMLEQAAGLVMGMVDNRHSGQEPQLIDDLLPGVLADLHQRIENKSSISGLPTGFADLDAKTCGLHAGDLIIIAGRPSMGKTTLALNIAENVALAGGTALVISLEMSAKQLTERSISRVGSIDTQSIRSGNLTEDDFRRLTNSLAKLQGKHLIIADDPHLARVARVRMAARRVRQRRGRLDLMVIDYLQLMSGDGATKNEELGGITRLLKLLARELACPIIALSQLSRKVEERTDKRPLLSDLRESGAIEQDADVVMMAYRDDYYRTDSPFKGFAEILIRKQRMGPLGDVPLVFQGAYSRFCDADRNEYAAAAAKATPSTVRGMSADASRHQMRSRGLPE